MFTSGFPKGLVPKGLGLIKLGLGSFPWNLSFVLKGSIAGFQVPVA